MIMKNLQEEFPILKDKTYLNTPACGLLPRSVLQWKNSIGDTLFQDPQKYMEQNNEILQNTVLSLSHCFTIPSDQIALIPNFSFGLNMVLDSLSSEEKIVLFANDYPSVNWPVEQRNFAYSYVTIDADLEAHIEQKIRDEKPTIVLFSIVQWLNGIKIDLNFIRRMKSEHPAILFIADGTQYLGTEAFDFSASGIDILITSGYKWLNAGFGNGFLAIKKEVQSRFHPLTIGFNSSTNFSDKPTAAEFMSYFEPGHQDMLSLGSIQQAIYCVDNSGRAEAYIQIKKLSELAKTEFSKRGWLEEKVMKRKEHSPIFNLKGDNEMYQKLVDHHVICAQRGGGIRLGFHYYNTCNDLDKLIELFN